MFSATRKLHISTSSVFFYFGVGKVKFFSDRQKNTAIENGRTWTILNPSLKQALSINQSFLVGEALTEMFRNGRLNIDFVSAQTTRAA